MFYNSLKSAFRYLLHEKIFSTVSVLGLTLGLTCSFCVILFVFDELSYDRYHSKSERIYRVIQGGESDEQSSSLPFPTGPALENDYPDIIKTYVRLFNFQASTLSIVYREGNIDKAFNEPRFYFADSSYFEIFDHVFIKGNPDQALSGPGAVVLTASASLRYFGTTDAIGKVIRFEDKYDLEVTGVVEDMPRNTHFKWDFLASFASLPALGFPIPEKNWYWNPVWTYVLLTEESDRSILQGQLPEFVQKYYHPSLKDRTELYLQPLVDIYLHSKTSYEIGSMSDIKYVKIFATIGSIILIVAIVNFINLSTARATDRFKEVGVRKVAGASRLNLQMQFLTESLVISLMSFLITIPTAIIILPLLNQLAGKTYCIADILNLRSIVSLFGIAILSGLLAGAYPSYYLSLINPASNFREARSGNNSKALLRKALTIFQFAVASLLIVGIVHIYLQTQYLENASTGFDKERIVVLPVQRLSIVPKYETFKDELLTSSLITSVTASNTLIGKENQSSNYKIDGEEDMSLYACFFVRKDFLTTLRIPLLAGSDFTEEITAPGYYGVINKELCEKWGWRAEEAVGKTVHGDLEGDIRIVGVTSRFSFAPLRLGVEPMIMVQSDLTKYKDFFTNFILIRIKENSSQAALLFIEEKWKEFVTESPFSYSFLDATLAGIYTEEERISNFVTVFSVLAIFISCLGLYSMALFSFRKRKKEVAVRKVLGATQRNVMVTLSKDILKLVLIGSIAGNVAAYYFVANWLKEYANHIDISILSFLESTLFLLSAAFLVTLVQTIRASGANPAIVLRSE